MKLLIVEDTEELIKSYTKDVVSYNLVNDMKIDLQIVTDKDKALALLNNSSLYFDAAIVDLKLDTAEKPDADYSGNDVLREIKGNLRFPVFIVTGTPEHLADDLRDQNAFFKLKTRGEEDNHIEQLVDIYKTGITNILGKKGVIEKYLNSIFWNHISNSIDVWVKDSSRTSEKKEKSLLRYSLLLMQEYIDEEIEKYHPSEFYFTPPIKKHLFTGDIMEFRKHRYLVLTPACDFSQKKVENILFIKIRDWETLDSEFKKRPLSAGKTEFLKGLLTNNKPRFHFIPKAENMIPGFIDFQNKLTVNKETVDNLIGSKKSYRIATISAPFLKDIISRYSYYYSRQGSPDFSTDEVFKSLF